MHPADGAPVSGRDTPRDPGPPVTHDVRFYGQIFQGPEQQMYAACEPCDWSVTVEGGHTAGELVALATMHTGGEAP